MEIKIIKDYCEQQLKIWSDVYRKKKKNQKNPILSSVCPYFCPIPS